MFINSSSGVRLGAALAVGAVSALGAVALGALPAAAQGTIPTQTVLTSSLNPSVSGNQSPTFTATVSESDGGSNGTPTGMVTFMVQHANGTFRQFACTNGGSGSTSRPLVAGQALCNTRLFGSGSPFTVTAVYNGNTKFASSTSNAVVQVVQPGPSTTTVSVNPPQPVQHKHATIEAFVRGFPYVIAAQRSGAVTFSIVGSDASVVNCQGGNTIPIKPSGKVFCKVGGQLQASASPYTVTASYPGDANFAPSTGTLTLPVSP
ncbi:MAG TPA: Ig-like domain-containing protein [Acidimicrobiales bacterium]|nr:Ig-like domain-containing protein [Acidimicrobiales bacterium]